MLSARPSSSGKTRNCPHCKAVILESASVCPGCRHHLKFGTEAAQREASVESALRVEGTIVPKDENPCEYCIVISVSNERGAEVARQIVNVGHLQPAEKRTFKLSVDMYPIKNAASQRRN